MNSYDNPEEFDAASEYKETYEDKARDIGTQHGTAAGSWVVDGNTKRGDLLAIILRSDEGEFFDYLDISAPLSGEWPGSYSYDDLASDVGYQTHDEDGMPLQDAGSDLVLGEIMTAYEDAYYEAFEAEAVRSAKAMLPEEETR